MLFFSEILPSLVVNVGYGRHCWGCITNLVWLVESGDRHLMRYACPVHCFKAPFDSGTLLKAFRAGTWTWVFFGGDSLLGNQIMDGCFLQLSTSRCVIFSCGTSQGLWHIFLGFRHWKSPAGWWVKINHGSTWYRKILNAASCLPLPPPQWSDMKTQSFFHSWGFWIQQKTVPCLVPFLALWIWKGTSKMIVTKPILSNGSVLPWVVCHPGVVCQPKLQTTFGIGYSYPNQKNLPR